MERWLGFRTLELGICFKFKILAMEFNEMGLEQFGKILILFALILLVTGILFILFSKVIKGLGLPRLPGDIYYKRNGFTFYFPIVTCIVISLILTLILNLIFLFIKK